MVENLGKIIVHIDKDLEDIAPGYLENRQKDKVLLPDLLKKGDFDSLRILGHRMKGSGAGYGFDAITNIGRVIEDASEKKSSPEIKQAIADLTDYLQRVEITYE